MPTFRRIGEPEGKTGENSDSGSTSIEADSDQAAQRLQGGCFVEHEINPDSLDSYEKARYEELDSKGASRISGVVDSVVNIVEATHGENTFGNVQESSSGEIDANMELPDFITDNSGLQKDSTPSAKKLSKSSPFAGVSYNKPRNNYQVKIGYKGKSYFAGSYKLQADSAFVYDQVANGLRMSKLLDDRYQCWKLNFGSVEEYEKARTAELIENGVDPFGEDLTDLTSKAKKYVDDIIKKFASTGVGHEENAEKEPVAQGTSSAADNTDDVDRGDLDRSLDDDDESATGCDDNEDAKNEASSSEKVEGAPSLLDVFTDNQSTQTGTAPAAQKASRFTGVNYIKRDNFYQARIGYNGKSYSAGCYKLGADAAFVYDFVVKHLTVANLMHKSGRKWRINFKTDVEYQEARAQELSEKGIEAIDVDYLSSISTKAQQYATSIVSKMQAIGDTTASHKGDPDHEKNNEIEPIACVEASAEVDRTFYNPHSTGSNLNYKNDQEGLTEETPSSYWGVRFKSQEKKYEAIFFEKTNSSSKCYYLGQYLLASDAAFAVDEAVRFRRRVGAKTNFKTNAEYERARSYEIEASGVDMSASCFETISARMQSLLRQFKAKFLTTRYRNVSFKTQGNKYEAKFQSENNKTYYLGQYILSADAAFAADEALRFQTGADANTNFKTKSDYERARSHEIEVLGVNIEVAGSLETISSKIQGYLAKFKAKCPSCSKKKPKKAKTVDDAEVAVPLTQKRVRARKRKLKQKTSTNTKKMCSNHKPHSPSVVDQLNTRHDASTKKWGSLLADQDWLQPDYEETYEQGIDDMLMDLSKTYVAFRGCGYSKHNESNTDDPDDGHSPALIDEDISHRVLDPVISDATGNREETSLTEPVQSSPESTKEKAPATEHIESTSSPKLMSDVPNAPDNRKAEDKLVVDQTIHQTVQHINAATEEDFVASSSRANTLPTDHSGDTSPLFTTDPLPDKEPINMDKALCVGKPYVEVGDELFDTPSKPGNTIPTPPGSPMSISSQSNGTEFIMDDEAPLSGTDTARAFIMDTNDNEEVNECNRGIEFYGQTYPGNNKRECDTKSTSREDSRLPINNDESLLFTTDQGSDNNQVNWDEHTAHLTSHRTEQTRHDQRSEKPSDDEHLVVPNKATNTNHHPPQAKSTLDKPVSPQPATSSEQTSSESQPNIPSLNTESASILRAQSQSAYNKNDSIPLNPDQTLDLPFPVGCSVWLNFCPGNEGEVFACGEVIGVSFNHVSREMFYEVKLNCGSTSWFTVNELAYSPMTPVFYLPTTLLDKDGGLHGQIVQTRTIPQMHHLNMQLVSQLNEALQSELSDLATSRNFTSACYKRMRDLLHQLDTKVSMDHLILELTRIEQTLKSVCNLASDTYDVWTPTRNLIDKWQAQVKDVPRFYYSVMVSSDDVADGFQVIDDIPSNQVKRRNDGMIKSD